MGCDIHMFIEYKRKEKSDWHSYGDKVNCGRNYGIFSRLAGVRGESDKKPKGKPKDLGYAADSYNKMYITDIVGEGNVSPADAERWVKNGSSVYITDSIGNDIWVTHPDWHSHSWATIEELAEAVKDYSGEIQYHAFLASMKVFQDAGYDVRCVYWFDN